MKISQSWLAAGTLCLLAPRLSAQVAPAAPAPLPLTEALRTLPAGSVLPGTVVLSVDAAKVLPLTPEELAASGQDALPAGVPETPSSLAVEYGRTGRVFGHVFALAPPTMTVLNPDPAATEFPVSVLARQRPLPYLLGTLTDSQMQRLGMGGLSWADLTPDQQTLLSALVPQPLSLLPKAARPPLSLIRLRFHNGPLTVQEQVEKDQQEKAFAAQFITVPEATLTTTARLRAFLVPQYNFDTPDNETIDVDYPNSGLDANLEYILSSTWASPSTQDKPFQEAVRAEVPNDAKPGDIGWTKPALEHTLPLAGAKTVGALVAGLAHATGLELYADARYEPLPLTLAGDVSKPQEAKDVMQALALCVCGTWRQVGPAYVLTDDVLGLGSRRAALQEAVLGWSRRLTDADTAAGTRLKAGRWLHLPFAPGDTGALTAEQMAAFPEEPGGNSGHLPWKSLPAPLQAGLRQGMDPEPTAGSDEEYNNSLRSVGQRMKPDTPVSVTFSVQMALELPGFGLVPLNSKFDVADRQEPALPTVGPHSLTLARKYRGLLCAPRTAAEARTLVTQMAHQGFPFLMVDVFTGGKTYFPNDLLPPASPEAAGVLQAALDTAKPLGIPVYAVIDTLCWRKNGDSPHPSPWPVGYAEDLTVQGEPLDASARRWPAPKVFPDSPEDFARQQHRGNSWASPTDPAVRRLLPALVRVLAGTKGLAGLAFQDTTPPGTLETDSFPDDNHLGFLPVRRLAFLRAYHVDPIDMGPLSQMVFASGKGSADLMVQAGIPTFPSSAPRGLYLAWSKGRVEANRSLLAECFQAARASAPALPLKIRESQVGFWFSAWSTPLPPKPQTSPSSDGFICLPCDPAQPVDLGLLSEILADDSVKPGLNDFGHFVFDLTSGGPPDNLSDTVDKLAGLLKEPKKAP